MKDVTNIQVKRIIEEVSKGKKVDRVRMKWIPDFRSRICDAQKAMGVRFERATKKGKKYREYWLRNPKFLPSC